MQTITEQNYEKGIVETTVLARAVEHPTNARLRYKVMRSTERHREGKIGPPQNYQKLMSRPFHKIDTHTTSQTIQADHQGAEELEANSSAYKVWRGQKMGDAVPEAYEPTMTHMKRVLAQKYTYKQEAPRPYEFRVKMSLALAHQGSFAEDVHACPGNPFDSRALRELFKQIERLSAEVSAHAFVYMVDKGHSVSKESSRMLISGTSKPGYMLKRHLRGRSTAKPGIGCTIVGGRPARNNLKGMQGEAIASVANEHTMWKILIRLRFLLYLSRVKRRGRYTSHSLTWKPNPFLNMPQGLLEIAEGVS